MIADEVIEAHALSTGTSTRKAELIALKRALELSQEKRANIYTDSKYVFMVLYTHGAIRKEGDS